MTDWRKTLVPIGSTIRQAIESVDQSTLQIALIVDQNEVLQGVLTDGDVRRGILRGVELDQYVTEIMNTSPVTVTPDDDTDSVVSRMKRDRIFQIPVVDEDRRVVGLRVLADELRPDPKENAVVLMAGGLGSRLQPLTHERPKPLLPVGDRPILETLVERLTAQGFRRFFMSVNYKADMIRDHFGDGSRWGASIQYIQETDRLGTAGSLHMVASEFDRPLMVINGDLLTKLDFRHLLDFHVEHRSMATMAVREYEYQVPYGVVQADGPVIVGLEEKPITRYLVNAGMYVLEPAALDRIPDDTFYDMTDLFALLSSEGRETYLFPIREYWRDIGIHEDYRQANGEYQAVFAPSKAPRPDID